jgi:hypothetical protein
MYQVRKYENEMTFSVISYIYPMEAVVNQLMKLL